MRLWWLALHAVLCGAAWSLGLPPGAAAALTLAAVLHARLRRPARPPSIVYLGNGRWAVPARCCWQLELGAGTAFSAHWVRLVLRSGNDRVTALLLHDQVDREAWWRLQTVLRSRPEFRRIPMA